MHLMMLEASSADFINVVTDVKKISKYFIMQLFIIVFRNMCTSNNVLSLTSHTKDEETSAYEMRNIETE